MRFGLVISMGAARELTTPKASQQSFETSRPQLPSIWSLHKGSDWIVRASIISYPEARKPSPRNSLHQICPAVL